MIKNISANEIETVRVNSCEAETSISWYRGDSTISIFTSDNTVLTRLKKCMTKNPKGWQCWEAGRDKAGAVTGYNFKAPKKAIRLVDGSERSEEQRIAASERARAKIATGWLPGQPIKEYKNKQH